MDGTGNELGRIEIDTNHAAAKSAAADFIRRHIPPKVDAQKKLDQALAEARSSGRKVWVQLGGTRCGPCFMLSRWLDDHRDVLEKDYVFVKVDGVRDENGIEISKRVTGDRNFGIPFVAIMDSDGKVLIDGNGPFGNVGFPSEFESVQHLRRMFRTTATNMTEQEYEAILETLDQ